MMKILTLRLSYNIILFETVSTEICEEIFIILHQSHHKIDFFEKYQQPNLCFVALCCHNLMASFINVIWAQYYLLDICIIHHYPENEGAKSWNLSKRFCSHQGINIIYLYSSYTLTLNKHCEIIIYLIININLYMSGLYFGLSFKTDL